MARVSIIVPVYKVEAYLEQCVQSLLHQTLKDIEVILVDDGSPDRCPEMCDSFAASDSRVKVVHKTNGGLGLACNSGLDIAVGEYVALLDSDDWADSSMYEKMIAIAEENDADIVYSGLKRVDLSGNPCGVLPHRSNFQKMDTREDLNALACDMIASDPSCRADRTIQMSAKVALYRRLVLEDNNIRFVSERVIPSEDLHFNLNAISHSKCVCIIPDRFYNYRVNPNSLTCTIKDDLFPKITLRYDYTVNECREFGISGDYVTRAQRMLIGYTRSYICSILNSSMDRSKKRALVSTICKDGVWKQVNENYPFNKMPLVHRVFAYGVRFNCFFILSILAKLK